MKAVRFHATKPRWITGKLLGKFSKSMYWSGLSCTTYEDIPEPVLPGSDWAVVKTIYGGICGSDMSAVGLNASHYFTPLTSFPFTFGHENVGVIAEIGGDVKGFSEGDRVVVEPTLWCRPRGFEDLCSFCQTGQVNMCERFTQGQISTGFLTGFCGDTGGSWSKSFLAHKSQLYKLPIEINDDNGLMVEPFAAGLHAVLIDIPVGSQPILVVGAGTIGLCTTAALRLLVPDKKIHVVARHNFQREAAFKVGADRVIQASRDSDVYQQVSEITGAQLLSPMRGKRLVYGGYERVYECVGSDGSLDDAIRFTHNGGKIILVSVPGISKRVDWSGIFSQELQVTAAYTYNHAENYAGTNWRTFDLARHFMQEGDIDLGWMVTHKFQLDQYSQALGLQFQRAKYKAIKTVFEFPD